MLYSKPRLSNTLFSMINRYMAAMGLMLFAVDLDDAEVKAAIKEAVDAAVKPLAEKRDELLNEVKQLRKGKQVSPEDLEKLEAERDQYKDQAEKLAKDLKAANSNAEKFGKELETEKSFTQRLLVENGLTEQLTKAGVTNPAFLKAASAILASQVQIVPDGDKRVAKVGEKPLADFVGEWAKSDDGKHFVSAPNNSGGGSGGNGNPSGGAKKSMTRTAFEALDPAGKVAFTKEGGQLTEG